MRNVPSDGDPGRHSRLGVTFNVLSQESGKEREERKGIVASEDVLVVFLPQPSGRRKSKC